MSLIHISGILRQDSGEILFDGEPVYENPVLKAHIGFVPDDLSYFAPYTMKDAVKYYQSLYPVWDQERYDEMRKAFDLGSGKKMNSFSKGMQKQAAFILTMCTRPKYLILDEPIDGLDPKMCIRDRPGTGKVSSELPSGPDDSGAFHRDFSAYPHHGYRPDSAIEACGTAAGRVGRRTGAEEQKDSGGRRRGVFSRGLRSGSGFQGDLCVFNVFRSGYL